MGKCIPCKQMKPILEELSAGVRRAAAAIEIIDIGEHPDQSDKYRIKLIPTQVFFDGAARRSTGTRASCRRRTSSRSCKEMGVE